MSADPRHEQMLTALRERSFERLGIRCLGPRCYLLVTSGGETHVFVDRRGNQRVYRHAWQIRGWLESHFSIDPETVVVESPG